MKLQRSFCAKLTQTNRMTGSLPLSRLSSLSSHILIVVSRPQQRLNFNGFVIFEVWPEKVHPISPLGLNNAEEIALKKVDKISEGTSVERTFASKH